MSTSTFVVDSAFIYIAAFCFLLFFIIVFLMAYFAVRYRRSRNPNPADISGNTFLEILWVVVPTLLVLTMFVYGLTGFSFLRHPPADSLHVKVVSRQWAWLFQYDNGVTSQTLAAPINHDVRLELTSQDVIHGFFVPAFRIKQDAV
ncbi:MAG: cytochrome c oxidase subunit II, partial [Methanothrix sp.]|nr:cytochrome c oxidase subunit II [Methanothrix sp.]